MKKLLQPEIENNLEKLPNWKYRDNGIETILEFENFRDCFTIMTRIAFEIEAQNHHPEWLNIYNTLSIRLSTHDANGVTNKDFKLAETIENLIA
ncbi:4a-hydroxytetrahydrobiopterin dehydratase [Aureibaculum conchae]|uniref:4a-hydroxytetrahydrobiopterin dehydratase n=1 Tax=Aureibaculum sp. 2308TA14-22 TaxID=3108392 RepID=UPI003393B96E